MSSSLRAECPHCIAEMACDIEAECKEEILYSYSHGNREECSHEGSKFYQILRCRGCEKYFYRTKEVIFEPDWIPCYETYPLVYSKRKLRDDIYEAISKELDHYEFCIFGPPKANFCTKLYEQILKSINMEDTILAALGMRSLLDSIMAVKTGDVSEDPKKGFAEHLDKFEVDKLITLKEKNLLKSVLEVGHSATHRQVVPELNDVCYCMKIIEHLIEGQFIIPSGSSTLNKYCRSDSKAK